MTGPGTYRFKATVPDRRSQALPEDSRPTLDAADEPEGHDLVVLFVVLAVLGTALCATSARFLLRASQTDTAADRPLALTVSEARRYLARVGGRHPQELYVLLKGSLGTDAPIVALEGGRRIQCVLVRHSILEERRVQRPSTTSGSATIVLMSKVVCDSLQTAPAYLEDSTGRLPLSLSPPPSALVTKSTETREPASAGTTIRHGPLTYQVPAELAEQSGGTVSKVVDYALRREVLPVGEQTHVWGAVRLVGGEPTISASGSPGRPLGIALASAGGPPPAAGSGPARTLLSIIGLIAGGICLVYSLAVIRRYSRLHEPRGESSA